MNSTAQAEAAAAAAAGAAAMKEALRIFNTELWTLYAFGVAFTIFRTYARVKAVGWREFRPDDYLVWLAVALYTTQSTLIFVAVNYAGGVANNSMTVAQRAALDPTSQEYTNRVFGSKIQVVGWTFYVCLIATLKIAVLFFYIRLMEGLSSHFRIRVWVGFGLVGATFLASILGIYAPCQPFHHYWQINPDPGNHCQAAISKPIVWSTFISSVITDIYLLLVPIPMLWGTTLRLAKKISITIVLGAGIFVLVCSLLKTVFVETDPVNGAQLAGQWGVRETFTSVITTNLPMIFPLLKTWLKPLMGSAIFSTKGNTKHPTGFRTIGDGGGGDASGVGRSRKGTKHTADSLTYSESEEQIINNNNVKMQNLETYAGPGKPGYASTKGIMVSKEMMVVEDQVSQHGSHNGDYDSKKVIQDSW
ncbi:hypothetical protein IFR05_015676 [Cadophora sp. M221]|nr:hypothetical protein IFR05_015676 [Cadophora sp. M221]